MGAFDFVAKPLTGAEAAGLIAKLQHRTLAAEGVGKARSTPSEIDRCVIGSSEGMARVKHMMKVSARTDANVLIYGETGVGKDLISAVIHRLSHRQAFPFVKVGCALFPASLIESELYGHEEG